MSNTESTATSPADRISDAWARAYTALRQLHDAFDDYQIADHRLGDEPEGAQPPLRLTTAQADVLFNRINWVMQDLDRHCSQMVPDDDRSKCQCPEPCSRGTEQCGYCRRELAHDYVHWNGDRYQCEKCSADEAWSDCGFGSAAQHTERDPRLASVDVRVKAATCYEGDSRGRFVPARCQMPTPGGGRCSHVITHEVSETAGHGTGYVRCCVWHLDDAVNRAVELATASALRLPVLGDPAACPF